MLDLNDRGDFLNLAAVFEGGLALLAVVLGFATGISPLQSLVWDWRAVAWGIAGAVPIFVFFLFSYFFSFGPLKRIKRFLLDVLGPPLAACRWYDLILLALLAGVGEELLFRGWLQVWIESHWGAAAGLVGSNILFGLAHCITAPYAILAGAIGVYLGVLFDASGERSLLVPVIAHALYDYLGFLIVVRTWKNQRAAMSGEPA